MVSAQTEKKLKRLQDLKRAKQQLLEYEQFNQINLNFKQKVQIQDNYLKKFEKETIEKY